MNDIIKRGSKFLYFFSTKCIDRLSIASDMSSWVTQNKTEKDDHVPWLFALGAYPRGSVCMR